jgi:hypothetical protein
LGFRTSASSVLESVQLNFLGARLSNIGPEFALVVKRTLRLLHLRICSQRKRSARHQQSNSPELGLLIKKPIILRKKTYAMRFADLFERGIEQVH